MTPTMRRNQEKTHSEQQPSGASSTVSGIDMLRGAATRWPIPQLLWRLGKFGIVGASGVGVNLGVFWMLSTLLGLHYLVSAAAAIEIAVTSNYLLNNNWTFADRRLGVSNATSFMRYHAVSIGGTVINLAILQVLVGALGLAPIVANLCGIVAATSWNFGLSLRWTWRSPPPALVMRT
jgi:dolichol-phosphate mannosyltransferase